MKKYAVLAVLVGCLAISACRKNVTYDRNDPDQSFERFINSHVFVACENVGKPYARYSLAELLKRPGNDDPRYKVKFINGPCKGRTVMTTEVITQTQPVEDARLLETGTLVLRNFDQPKTQDKNITDHWNIGVVMESPRVNKGIINVGFPRDRNDFFPARESVHMHNVRTIVKPALKDVRNFIN